MQRVSVRRRSWLVAIALGASAIVAPTVASSPAGAVNAPLVTEDGIGIRIDEWAIQGPALEAIETALQPTVDDLVQDGAEAAQIMDNPDHVISDSNLELAFDILAPSSPSRPYGALQFNARIEDIEIEYYRYGEWWQPECWIWINPEDSTIQVTANVDPTNLPAAPIEVQPAVAYWDDDPAISTNNGWCYGYLFNEWWDGFAAAFSGDDPESTASRVEDQIDAMSQDLVDQVWDENVVPVLDSLANAGITVSDLHTDAYGLIVKADVDATGGLTIPGMQETPVDVTTAQDSGADSNVDTLLANYDEIIVSIHPNVVNQYLYVVNVSNSGNYGQPLMNTAPTNGPAIETMLIPPANQGSYSDTNWSVRMNAQAAPYVTPDPTTGAPKIQFPAATFQFRNGFSLVATFTGTFTGLDLTTEVRAGTTNWGPAIHSTNSSLNVTRTQANAHASLIAAQTSSQILPYAKVVWEKFNVDTLESFASLAPIELYDLTVSLCTTCGRYSGDERYTETFRVN